MSRTGEIRARVPNFPVDGQRGKGMRREASGIRSKGGRMRERYSCKCSKREHGWIPGRAPLWDGDVLDMHVA